MLYYTHVNRGTIDSNRKHGTNDPPIAVKRGKHGTPRYGREVVLPAGTRLVYSAHQPILPCGARLVAISTEAPEIVTKES